MMVEMFNEHHHSFLQVSVEALISVSGKVYYSSKTKKIFLTRFSKEQQQKASAKIPQKPCEMDKMASWIIMIYLFIRPMPPDRLVVVDSETQEIAWRRSQVDHFDREKKSIYAIDKCPQSKGVKKYKFKIKKENERCLEYLVEDLDHEDENIKFTIPLAFQVFFF